LPRRIEKGSIRQLTKKKTVNVGEGASSVALRKWDKNNEKKKNRGLTGSGRNLSQGGNVFKGSAR